MRRRKTYKEFERPLPCDSADAWRYATHSGQQRSLRAKTGRGWRSFPDSVHARATPAGYYEAFPATNDPKWKRFEKLAYEIQKGLAQNATVTLNDSIPGVDSKTNRQIDISIRESIGQYSIIVVIDCKDYKEPVDVKDIEEFAGLVRDVRANKGAMISSNGFTPAAVNIARAHGMDVFRLVDTDGVDWGTYVSIPVLLERTYIKGFSMEVIGFGAVVLPAATEDLVNLELCTEDGRNLGSTKHVVQSRWDKQEIPHTPGTCEILIGKNLSIQFAGRPSKVDVSAVLNIATEYYFGPLPIHTKGLHDVKDGGLITKTLQTGNIEPGKIERGLVPGWAKIDDASKLSVRPVMRLSYADCYGGDEPTADGAPERD